ncbi:MAG: hypothetical protein ACUVQ1_06605 [Candidatus Kapaibacteriales bacterium]
MLKSQLQTIKILASINFSVALLFLISYFLTKEFLYLAVSFANIITLVFLIFLVFKLNKHIRRNEQ